MLSCYVIVSSDRNITKLPNYMYSRCTSISCIGNTRTAIWETVSQTSSFIHTFLYRTTCKMIFYRNKPAARNYGWVVLHSVQNLSLHTYLCLFYLQSSRISVILIFLKFSSKLGFSWLSSALLKCLV